MHASNTPLITPRKEDTHHATNLRVPMLPEPSDCERPNSGRTFGRFADNTSQVRPKDRVRETAEKAQEEATEKENEE